jgi:hypothetical protein
MEDNLRKHLQATGILGWKYYMDGQDGQDGDRTGKL